MVNLLKMVFPGLLLQGTHILTKLSGLCAWCVRSLLLEISAQKFLNSLLRLILLARSSTTSATSRAGIK